MYFFNNFTMATLATSATNQDNVLTEKIVEKSNGNMGIAKMILDSLKHNQELFNFIMRHEVSDMQTFYQIYNFYLNIMFSNNLLLCSNFHLLETLVYL